MKPLDKEHCQKVLHKLAGEGVEMTPEELDQTRKSAFDNIRRAMRAHGYEMPDSDEELFLIMQQVYRRGDGCG